MSETLTPHADVVTLPRGRAELLERSAALLDRMLVDPTLAPAAEDLIKKVNPNAVFPQRASREALLAPVNEAVEKVRTETAAQIASADERAAVLQRRLDDRDAREAAAAATAQESALTDRIRAVQARRGFSDEKMQEVLARMRDQNNPDVESAAAWVAESIPKPLPATGHDFLPSTVDMFGSSAANPADTAWKHLHENPTQWQTQELRNIVRDPEFLRLGNAA